MPYTKTSWKDRSVEKPMTYTLQTNADGTTTLIGAEGTIIEPGTPINASVMNNLETQYDQAVLESLPRIGGNLTGELLSNSRIYTSDIIEGNEVKATTFFTENGVHLEDKYLKLIGGELTGGLNVHPDQGGNALKITSNPTSDHVYMEFYARGATPTTRSGYLGYTSAGQTALNMTNSLGDILLNPTGALKVNGTTIVAQGSNSNGEWVQFYDGTMICRFNGSTTGTSIATAYGSLFQGARTWTFPIAFTVAPVVMCGQFKWGTGASWGMVNNSTTTNSLINVLDTASRATGTTVSLMHLAIGKWK